MSWRARVDEVLQARDTRDNWATRAAIVPSGPTVPAPLDLLRLWRSSLESLDPCQPRDGFTMGRWQKLFDCSVWWLEGFGRQAALDGWCTSDVFGLVPQVEGYGGLIDQLGDHRGLVMHADTARWRWRGERPQVYRRGSWPDLTAWWECKP